MIARLLEEDAQRRAEKASRGDVYEWREPRFDGPVDQRRLRIVNAIVLALERVDAEPDARTTMGLQFGAAVGDTWVPIEVAAMAKPKPRRTCDGVDEAPGATAGRGHPWL